jgi:toxin ParE1/3/4
MPGAPKSGKPLRVVLSPAAQSDIREALLWSRQRFGERAAIRYRELLKQAIHDIATDPNRPGSQERHELAGGVRAYHLLFSRGRAKNELGSVGKPRHFLVYRHRDHAIDLIRVLHDARDLKRHIPPDSSANNVQ